jgi:hypothetical protein
MKNKEQPKPLLCRFKATISVKTNGKLYSFSKTTGFVDEKGDKRLQEEVKQILMKSYKEMANTNKELRRKLNIQATSKVRIYISVKVLECDRLITLK